MKRTFKYSAVSLFLLFSESALAGNSFSSFYSFGDSLSDGGYLGSASRFIAGSNSQLYNEILSSYYTGEALTPFDAGGNNYAEAGATAANASSGLLRTDLQIDYYLSQNGGKADKNGLYILWIGANDISYDVKDAMSTLNFAGLTNSGDNYQLSQAPEAVASQTKTLLDAGAGYVIVPTVPHAGLTPWTATALFSVAQTVFGQNIVNLPQLYSQLDAALRGYGDVTNEAQREQAVKESINQVLRENGVTLPEKWVDDAYNTVLEVENRLTDQFNHDTEQGLDGLSGNIVRPDVAKLFDEIISSPKTYGFDNVLAPVCQIGVGAPFCNEDSPTYHDDQVYMFSDWFHPSPQAHAVIAQYIISVLDAPLYVTSLSKALEGMNDEHQTFLDGQLQQLRATPDDKKVVVFGGYSGKYRNVKDDNDQLNGHDRTNNGELGFAIQAMPGWMVGGTLSAGNGDYHVNDRYRYDYRGKVMSLFTQLKLDNGLWGNIDTSFGDIDLTNIRRSIPLGAANRVERGSTTADSFGVSLNAGYDFSFADYFATGPVLGYTYNKYKVRGYREDGENSTSMHFSDQRKEMNVGRIGWRLDTHDLAVNPYLETTWNRNFNDDASSVAAAVNSTKTSFRREGGVAEKSWADVTVGASTKFTDNLGMFGSVSYSNGTHDSYGVNYAVGVNYRF